mmetsp:Transcript_6939/g.17928  ORF Transcript_6939/g.17928 Transcript_6939/m.17928 type:complete len:278 (-) Transcript_6939:238-1071(-)
MGPRGVRVAAMRAEAAAPPGGARPRAPLASLVAPRPPHVLEPLLHLLVCHLAVQRLELLAVLVPHAHPLLPDGDGRRAALVLRVPLLKNGALVPQEAKPVLAAPVLLLRRPAAAPLAGAALARRLGDGRLRGRGRRGGLLHERLLLPHQLHPVAQALSLRVHALPRLLMVRRRVSLRGVRLGSVEVLRVVERRRVQRGGVGHDKGGLLPRLVGRHGRGLHLLLLLLLRLLGGVGLAQMKLFAVLFHRGDAKGHQLRVLLSRGCCGLPACLPPKGLSA